MIILDKSVIDNSKFPLGQVVITQGAASQVSNGAINYTLQRHSQGDWGDMDPEDKSLNDQALEHGGDRIFSAYELTSAHKIWIITERDRSATTILLPEEY